MTDDDGVVILPPWQCNALVERIRTAIPTHNSRRHAKQTNMGIHIEGNAIYANKHTQYRYVTVANVSTECLNNCLLIF